MKITNFRLGLSVRRLSTRVGLALGILALASIPLLADGIPTGVSPGHTAHVTVAPSACPAFSWTEVPAAQGYEIAVFLIGDDHEPPREVLKQELPSGATSWTPSLDQCFARGERYGWTVRALNPRGDSEWSSPNLFQVAAGPTEDDFEAALDVVRSYLGVRGTSPGPSAEATISSATPPGTATPVSGETTSPLAPPPPGTQLAVDGNVHATSFSGDGAMLGGVVAVAGDSATDFFASGRLDKIRIDNKIARDSEVNHKISTALGLEPLDCPAAVGSADRYTDCGDGTIRDNNTGLVWLKDASCDDLGLPGLNSKDSWSNAVAHAANLADGMCGLTDGSVAGDWRLPEIEELCSDWSTSWPNACLAQAASDSLIDITLPIGSPLVVNAAGTGSWAEGDAFIGIESKQYWSATESASSTAYTAHVGTGNVDQIGTGFFVFIWPVRDGGPTTSRVAVSRGGTGATTATGARANLGAASAADLATHEAIPSAHHAQPTSLPPSGSAGGSLAGTYPNPTFAPDSVSSSEITDGTIAEADLAFDPATQAELDAVAPSGECEGFAINGRRFIDRGDGTVRDCDTGKIWLRDADCLGSWPWADVGDTIFTKINELNSAVDFSCGDYVAGTYTDWEVPDLATLEGIVDSSISGTPKVYSGKGDAGWTPGNVFLAIQGSLYWSATEVDATNASCVGMNNGDTFSCGKTVSHRLWPVRSD